MLLKPVLLTSSGIRTKVILVPTSFPLGLIGSSWVPRNDRDSLSEYHIYIDSNFIFSFVEKRYLSIIFWNNLEYSGISSLPFQYQDTIYVDSKFYIQLYGGLGESYSITCIHDHTSIIFYIVSVFA